jgi:hypothetical protein
MHQLPRGGTQMKYRFRTLRGDIIVCLAGHLDPNQLSFRPDPDCANEGDIILF